MIGRRSPWPGERAQVGSRGRAALAGQRDETKQNLRRCPGVWQRTMAGLGRSSEKHGKGREAHALDTAAQKPAREHHRVDDGRSQPAAVSERELVVDERNVEPDVVPGEDAAARDRGKAAECGRRRLVRSDGYLELPDDLTTFHEHRTHLADPRLTRHEACGLEVDDGKACPVEWNRRERSG